MNEKGVYMMEIYIILTDTGTFFTKMIKMFTKYPLNHASISFNRNLETTYSFGRKRPNNPFFGGMVKENLQGELFQQANCAIYKCSVSNQVYYQMLHLVKRMEQNKNMYKYNFLGLFGVLSNKEWNRKNAFFCSEFVATILSNGGISVNNKPACLVSPKDFTECKDLVLMYEGKLSTYLSRYIQLMDKDSLKMSKKFSVFKFYPNKQCI